MLGNTTDKTYSAENVVTSYDRRCIAEWNMNYYFDIVEPLDTLYGTIDTEFFKRFFPLKEVVRGWRPPAGAFRARLGAFRKYQLRWPTAADRSNLSIACNTPVNNEYTLKTRNYLALDNSQFKYYESPLKPSDAAFVDPYIEYQSNNLYANKVVVTFQRTAGIPKDFSIQIKNSGGWVTIGTFSNVSAVNSNGEVILYYNGTSWSTTQPADSLLIPANTVNVRGIKVIVNQMATASNVNDNNAYVSIIEMSPRALLAFTDRLQSWDWSANLAEKDTILPIGSTSSNSGSVVLNNNDGLLEPDLDATSPSYGYFMRKYGKVFVEYKASTAGSSWVNQFTGYIETPNSDGVYESVTLNLFDKLKFAQDIPAHDLLLRNHTPTAIIYTLLDLAGLGPIKIKHDASSEPKLTYFYSNKEETVFDAIQELCRAHQYAVTVDEDDNIVILTKGYIFATKTNKYVLTTTNHTDSGIDYIPNVSSYSDTYSEIINSANITYRPLLDSSAPDPAETAFKTSNQVAYSRRITLDLWRPTDPLLLGCVSHIKNIGVNDTSIFIDRTARRDPPAWGSYSGYALIDSEIIKFDGLEFAYTPKSGAPASPRVAKNVQEFQEIVSYANGAVTFTGKLCNVERGQFGTVAEAHTLALSGWNKSPAAKLTKAPDGNGFLQIRSTTNGPKRLAYAVKVIDADSYWVNTRMSIDNINTKVRSAGIIVSATVASGLVTGLYVEVSQGTNSKNGLLSVYRVNNSVIGKSPLTDPVAVSTPKGKPFNLSVFYNKAPGTDKRTISVFIDGERVLRRIISTNLTLTRKVGVAAAGDTSARFDYIYGGRGASESNNQTALDGQLKNYVNDVVKRDRGQLPARAIPSLKAVGFERFDDYVREMYVEDVRFERGPATNVLYTLTPTTVRDARNGKNVALGSELAGAVWGATPFGATVTIANISSRPLVVAYVDANNSATLYPYIYGNIVEEFGETRYEWKDESSIFRNGEKKYEFTSRWINNSDSAKKLANFVVSRAADPRLELDLDVWSPHVLQVGDEVLVKIPEKGIDKNFIVFAIDKGGEDVVKASVRLVEK
jgi:hypothetical protein